jgi:hypothetical protein
MAAYFLSCGSTDLCNRKEAKSVLNNFAREYTGLDTLIRIDGYYYYEDSTTVLDPHLFLVPKEGNPFLCHPLILSNDSEFKTYYASYINHTYIQEDFRKNPSAARGRGSYTLSGDTINVRWAMPFQYDCYNIFSQQYVIINDTTLKRIWHFCETFQNTEDVKHTTSRNEIFKFYQYAVEK